MSMRPRTAFTGVPSGAFTDSGTPKKARKYSDGVSSSISPPMTHMLPRGSDAAPLRRSCDPGTGSSDRTGSSDGTEEWRRV